MYKIWLWVILIWGIDIHSLLAQEDSLHKDLLKQERNLYRSPKLGIGLTGATYVGDLTDGKMQYNRFYPGVNFSLQNVGRPSSRLQMQLNAGFGAISEQSDMDTLFANVPKNIHPNIFVYTPFYYGDIRFKVKPIRRVRLQPYLSTGVGILLFSPEDEFNNLLVEKPNSRPKGEDYNTYTFYIPATAGLDFKLSKALSIGFDYTYRILNTDYIDNISQLGYVTSKDKLHSLQVCAYFTPGAVLKPVDTLIYIPPQKEPQRIDTILAKHDKTAPYIVRYDSLEWEILQGYDFNAIDEEVVDNSLRPQEVDTLLMILLDKMPANYEKKKPEKLTRITTIECVTWEDKYQPYFSELLTIQRSTCFASIKIDATAITVPLLKTDAGVEEEFAAISGESFLLNDDEITPEEKAEIVIQTGEIDLWVFLENKAIEEGNYFYYECKSGDDYDYLYNRFKIRPETILRLNQRAKFPIPPSTGVMIMPDIRKWIAMMPDVERIREDVGIGKDVKLRY